MPAEDMRNGERCVENGRGARRPVSPRLSHERVRRGAPRGRRLDESGWSRRDVRAGRCSRENRGACGIEVRIGSREDSPFWVRWLPRARSRRRPPWRRRIVVRDRRVPSAWGGRLRAWRGGRKSSGARRCGAPGREGSAGVVARSSRSEAPWLLVLRAAPDPLGRCWLKVRLPSRPNDAAAWVNADRVVLQSTPWRLVVSLPRALDLGLSRR